MENLEKMFKCLYPFFTFAGDIRRSICRLPAAKETSDKTACIGVVSTNKQPSKIMQGFQIIKKGLQKLEFKCLLNSSLTGM